MKIFRLALIFIMLLEIPVFASTERDIENLINFYVKKFTPERAEMMASELPDANAEFHEIYMNLDGIVVESVRLDSLCVRMTGVKFNPISEWAKGDVKFDRALQIYGYGKILEKDINAALKSKTFGKEDVWHDMSIKLTPKGLEGRGYYLAKTALLNLDILIEIKSGLKIVGGKEIWLDKPTVKINRVDVPDAITKKAIADIQPLLDLGQYPDLPIRLNKIEFKKGEAILSTKLEPKPLTSGYKYNYVK